MRAEANLSDGPDGARDFSIRNPLLAGTQRDQDAAVWPQPAGRRRRGTRRMLRPDGGGHYEALAVVDVDLDCQAATLVPPVTDSGFSPAGVHALVWLHGHPIGELTLPGNPATLLPTLPRVAARELAQAVDEHRLRDALSTPDGLAKARAGDLEAIPHPEEAVDGCDVTVAICTRDRPDDLRRCLAAVRDLDPAPAEVLVVDNASVDDRTRLVAEEYGVRCVREPRAGLDWARNRALLEARTGIVAFTDDDVLVHPGWIAGLMRAFQEEPGAVAVTGLVVPAELATPAQVLFEACGGFGRGYSRQWMSVALEDGEVAAQVYPGTGGAGTGANMTFRREEILALGGFDPALDVGTPTGGGGDLEMYFRVLAAGHLLVYEPSAVVRHVHRRTEEQLLRQMRGHGTGTYSIFLGAGRAYGRRQSSELFLFGLWWCLLRHVRAHIAQALGRRPLPWALDRAETAGMLGAVGGRYYRRAREQAERERHAHPTEPIPPALVRPRALRSRRQRDPLVITADLASWPGGTVVRGDQRSALVWLRVVEARAPITDVVFRSGGSGASPARLRWEMVRHLGPALIRPGWTWVDLDADRLAPAAEARSDRAGSRGAPMYTVPSHEIIRVPEDATSTLQRQAEPGGSPSSEVVVLLHRDLEVTDHWLAELLAPFGDPAVAVVTGNVLPVDPAVSDGGLWDHHGVRDRGPHRVAFGHDWLRASRGPARLWDAGNLANAAVRRSAIPHLRRDDGGDPAAVVVSEDFLYRVLRAGGRIVYQPSAVALRPRQTDVSRKAGRAAAKEAAAVHVASLLNVVVRHRDPRGLLRLGLVLPRQRARRIWHWLRGRDDVSGDLLLADLTGLLTGLAWRKRRGW